MIKRLAHVCIAAADLEEAEKFYCGALGFEKVFHFIRDNEVFGFYLRISGETYLEVFRRDTPETGGGFPIQHMCLEVENIDAVIAHLTALGYEVTEKKLGADHSWQAWVTAPSGVRIEFHQYTPESSQITGRNCIIG